LLSGFLFLVGARTLLLRQLHDYLYVWFLFGFLVGALASGPEEGPADRSDDENYGQQEQDERAFAHRVPPVKWWMCEGEG
jgi:hypothetical protein